MQWGQQVSFYGESDQFPDTITGDVIFILNQAPSTPETSQFTRSGSDLTVQKEISLIEALSGAKILLKHLDDRMLLISTEDIVQPGIFSITPLFLPKSLKVNEEKLLAKECLY